MPVQGKPSAETILQSLSELMLPIDESVASFKGLIYGPSGVGKTVMAMQIAQQITPADKVILYVDSARGIDVLNNHPELRPRVKRLPFKNQFAQISLMEVIRDSQGWAADIGCVVYDEFSSMVDADLDDIMLERARLDPSTSPDQAILQDYNKNQNRMKRVVELSSEVDCHVILIAHETSQPTPKGVPRTVPLFREKFGPIVKRTQHLVGYLIANDVEANGEVRYERVLQVQPTQKVDAKSRVGTFTRLMVPANDVPAGISKWLDNGGQIDSSMQNDIHIDTDTSSDDYTGIEG